MNTLIVWETGKQLSFYSVPSELVNPYFNVQGVAIGRGNHQSQQTQREIEHLAYMLGEEEFHGKTIPVLPEFLENPEVFQNNEERHGKGKKPKRKFKAADAPWSKYRVPDSLEVDNVERILHTGWLDEDVAAQELVEQNTNKEQGNRGQAANFGGHRGEVTDPAHDRRLRGNRAKPPSEGAQAQKRR